MIELNKNEVSVVSGAYNMCNIIGTGTGLLAANAGGHGGFMERIRNSSFGFVAGATMTALCQYADTSGVFEWGKSFFNKKDSDNA